MKIDILNNLCEYLLQNFSDIIISDKDKIFKYLENLSNGEFSNTKGVGSNFVQSIFQVPYCKNIGIHSLLKLTHLAPDGLIIDLLGGSGQVTLAAKKFNLFNETKRILTADIEIYQVLKALSLDIPAIPLDINNLAIIKDKVFSCALIAYGFHHISLKKRRIALKESFRTLKSKGILILHEGIHGSLMARISNELIDILGSKPHFFPHPKLDELFSLFDNVGFKSIREFDLFDPQIFFSDSADSVLFTLKSYFENHYYINNNISDQKFLKYLKKICNNHQFSELGDNIRCLKLDNLYNPIYLNKLYIGKTPDEIFNAAFPNLKRPLELHRYCIIIPRYAKIIVGEK